MAGSLPRHPAIDSLRGVAILAVLLLHFTLAFGLKNSSFAALLGVDAARAILFNGNYGVTLFFVVSGYLITSMSINRWGAMEDIVLRDFYALRFARIMPPLLLALAIIVTLGCLDVPYFTNSDGGHQLPASFFLLAAGSVLTFWHNVLMQSEGWFNYCLNIYWSLSVEEVFYVGLPILALTLRRQWLFVALCLALIAYGPAYRMAHADDELYFECGYAACFDAIAMGCLVALLVRRWVPDGHLALAARLTGLAGMVVTWLIGIHGHEAFGFSVMACFAALYLVGAARSDDAPGSRWLSPLRWLGRHSYELYLFHIIVLALMRSVFARGELQPLAWTGWLLLYLALSSLVATLVAARIADPANAWLRQRLLRTNGGTGVAAT
jgi:peptidoglycan/LPS O-acetylase OafA/YrhL